jgi:carbon storage regulator CsrA
MLVLSRRPGESILFPDFNAAVQVVDVRGGAVRLGIDAPREVNVVRAEIADSPAGPRPAEGGLRARLDELTRLLERRLGAAGTSLADLREHLLSGRNLNVLVTLDAVEVELRRLRAYAQNQADAGSCSGAAVVGPRPKALVVEDNPQERELLARCLRFEGVEVDTAGDGCDALDYLQARSRPDVVLLDMGMPRLDGPATVQAIRRNPACAGLKIFAVSGHTAGEYNLSVGPAGVDRWFVKPIDPSTLVRDINRELAQTPSGR